VSIVSARAIPPGVREVARKPDGTRIGGWLSQLQRAGPYFADENNRTRLTDAIQHAGKCGRQSSQPWLSEVILCAGRSTATVRAEKPYSGALIRPV
jgi:hypothetical protein